MNFIKYQLKSPLAPVLTRFAGAIFTLETSPGRQNTP
jgi:hypothetical protein